MGDSNISWTNKTWNPVTGCSIVSPGCEHCYAATLSLRHGWTKKPWTAINAAENVVCHPERLRLPLTWRKPSMVFVNSMSDLFHEQVPDGFIDKVFAVMASAERHTFQVLTKRPERMRDYVTTPRRAGMIGEHVCGLQQPMGCPDYGCSEGCEMDGIVWPLPNVWLGTSVEDQRRLEERTPDLMATPATVRFLSCEPLLGPILFGAECAALDWIIVGGESGPGFRPMRLDWARGVRDWCREVGTAFFYKQGSSFRPGQDTLLDGREWHSFP